MVKCTLSMSKSDIEECFNVALSDLIHEKIAEYVKDHFEEALKATMEKTIREHIETYVYHRGGVMAEEFNELYTEALKTLNMSNEEFKIKIIDLAAKRISDLYSYEYKKNSALKDSLALALFNISTKEKIEEEGTE